MVPPIIIIPAVFNTPLNVRFSKYPSDESQGTLLINSTPYIQFNPLNDILNWNLYSFDEINKIKENKITIRKQLLDDKFWDISEFEDYLNSLEHKTFIQNNSIESWEIFTLNSGIEDFLKSQKKKYFFRILKNDYLKEIYDWLDSNISLNARIIILNNDFIDLYLRNKEEANLFKLKFSHLVNIINEE